LAGVNFVENESKIGYVVTALEKIGERRPGEQRRSLIALKKRLSHTLLAQRFGVIIDLVGVNPYLPHRKATGCLAM
jgi:hypothetical protein